METQRRNDIAVRCIKYLLDYCALATLKEDNLHVRQMSIRTGESPATFENLITSLKRDHPARQPIEVRESEVRAWDSFVMTHGPAADAILKYWFYFHNAFRDTTVTNDARRNIESIAELLAIPVPELMSSLRSCSQNSRKRSRPEYCREASDKEPPKFFGGSFLFLYYFLSSSPFSLNCV
jgi:hypothetical protein